MLLEPVKWARQKTLPQSWMKSFVSEELKGYG